MQSHKTRLKIRAFTLVELPAVSKRKRFAFTLVELLVVITVIGILVGMLIPAVQSARESARRSRCQNNMRQIAMGIIMYEGEREIYPPVRAHADCTACARWGVLTWILPYMEEGAVYDELNLDEDFNHADNEPFTSASVPFAICPSAPRGRQVAGGNCSEVDFGLSDYTAVTRMDKNGFSSLVTAGVIEDRGGADREAWDGILAYRNPDPNPLYDKRLTNAQSCTDGLSNTFLFYEDAGRPQLFVSGVEVACDCSGPLDTCPNGAPWASDLTWIVVDQHINGRFINVKNHNEVYSFHAGGANFAYGDGGVRYESERMDPELFVRRVTRADGRITFRD
jgi:prepilin-type N-terminal cleavage/methylation domain-containing protein/prepilin-type processing-associated H-X9-DG protein